MASEIMVAFCRSPETPELESPSKNIRSPTSDARLTMMSASYSLRHEVNCSSIGIGLTKPR